MAGLNRFSYTDKDHQAIVEDCIARIKQVYGSQYWNDFEEDNAGRMLLEAFAYVADLLLFYLDRQANETYLPTATERQNLINLCRLIGYIPKSAKPALARITVSIDDTHSLNVTLPAYSALETQDGLTFETQSEAVIPAGELEVDIDALEGETLDEVVGVSDGEAWQEFYLPRSGVIEILDATIAGHTWSVVDSLADQLENAEVFSVDIDAWRRAEVLFGDGRTGKIPPADENISVRYRIGGGVVGNVAPDTITNVRNIATDSAGHKVSVNVTNRDWASGGADPESIESIKLWAPRYYEAQNRCVTQQDYEAIAIKFNGIAKARAFVRERSGEANVISLYVLTYSSIQGSVALPSQALKDDLLAYMNRYKMLTDWIEVTDGSWRFVDFTGNVIISDGFSPANIRERIKAALQSLMDIETREMGQPLRISDVYAAIDNIEGVIFVELDTPTQTITPMKYELLLLGNIDFNISLRGSVPYGQNF